jgi:hypothetical protein
MAIADLLRNFGGKVGDTFASMGSTPLGNLTPEQQRRQNQMQGLRNLGEQFQILGAMQSNRPQQAAFIQNQIKQREIDALNAEQKRKFNEFLSTPDGSKYQRMVDLLGVDLTRQTVAKNMFAKPSDRKIIKGNDGFNYYADSGERVLPNVQSAGQDIDTWSITDSDGNRVTDLINPSAEDLEKQVDSGAFINKTPVLSTAGKGAKEIGEIPGWNDKNGLLNRYKGYQGLVSSGQRIIDNLKQSPDSVLLTGDMAQIFNQLGQEITAMTGLIDRKERNALIDKTKPEVRNNFSKLAQETAITESQLLDFAYQIAKVRGQEGRGLSDQDFKNFQKIISAGRTAEEKAAALTNFIEGIKVEVKSGLDEERDFRNQGLIRNPDDKESNFVMNQIQDINSVGFRQITNPFAQIVTTPAPVTTNNIDALVEKYGTQ